MSQLTSTKTSENRAPGDYAGSRGAPPIRLRVVVSVLATLAPAGHAGLSGARVSPWGHMHPRPGSAQKRQNSCREPPLFSPQFNKKWHPPAPRGGALFISLLFKCHIFALLFAAPSALIVYQQQSVCCLARPVRLVPAGDQQRLFMRDAQKGRTTFTVRASRSAAG